MRVGVEHGASWVATTPTMLVKEGYYTGAGNNGRAYDIAPDGQRFLMIKEGAGTDQAKKRGTYYQTRLNDRRHARWRGRHVPESVDGNGPSGRLPRRRSSSSRSTEELKRLVPVK